MRSMSPLSSAILTLQKIIVGSQFLNISISRPCLWRRQRRDPFRHELPRRYALCGQMMDKSDHGCDSGQGFSTSDPSCDELDHCVQPRSSLRATGEKTHLQISDVAGFPWSLGVLNAPRNGSDNMHLFQSRVVDLRLLKILYVRSNRDKLRALEASFLADVALPESARAEGHGDRSMYPCF